MADFASIKLPSTFVAWLKVEAAIRGVAMYELLEDLVKNGIGGSPWEHERIQRRIPRKQKHRHRRSG